MLRSLLSCPAVLFLLAAAGEAQQVDRMMSAFATVSSASCAEKPFLPSIDAAYLLAFAIIMLNTGLHNPNIKADR